MPKRMSPVVKVQILQVVQDNGGTCGFTTIWEKTKHSKSTIAKYLGQMVGEGLLTPYAPEGVTKPKYQITHEGSDELLQGQAEVARITAVKPAVPPPGQPAHMQQLISFYKSIFADDTLIGKITILYSRLGDKIIQLAEGTNREEVYWALFYIFVNSTVNIRQFSLNMREFCDLYSLKRISLEYFLDKILSLDVGLHRVNNARIDCFYHDQDEFGANLARLIDEFLAEYQFRKAREEPSKSTVIVERSTTQLPVAAGAQQILDDLIAKNLLPEIWREPFTEAVRQYIVRRAMDHGLKPEDLPSQWPAEEEEQSVTYLAHVDELLGFCSQCGNWVKRGMRACPRCGQEVTEETPLVTDFREARDLTRKYKEQQAEQYTNCPHCGYRLVPGFMGKCPSCDVEIELPPEDAALD